MTHSCRKKLSCTLAGCGASVILTTTQPLALRKDKILSSSTSSPSPPQRLWTSNDHERNARAPEPSRQLPRRLAVYAKKHVQRLCNLPSRAGCAVLKVCHCCDPVPRAPLPLRRRTTSGLISSCRLATFGDTPLPIRFFFTLVLVEKIT